MIDTGQRACNTGNPSCRVVKQGSGILNTISSKATNEEPRYVSVVHRYGAKLVLCFSSKLSLQHARTVSHLDLRQHRTRYFDQENTGGTECNMEVLLSRILSFYTSHVP